jgi:hypothetical protein
MWGCSSIGRALAWHARGKGFDPPQLHQNYLFVTVIVQKLIDPIHIATSIHRAAEVLHYQEILPEE